jgi:RNA polymerase sigma factor (sigma-70 family)|tara:strand:+ start:573 stop:1139 length:567 start_codon:yes stop_codon:yes gene_type:complete
MTEIYIEISKLTDTFRSMAYRFTTDEKRINDAVQELMLYFLQMNPDTLKSIYEKDGIIGITKYGAVALRRSLTSKRSPFYYKYDKYYKNLVGQTMSLNYSQLNKIQDAYHKSIYNLPDELPDNQQLDKLEKIDLALDDMNWYDRELFKLYYYEGNTLDSLAEKTRISRNSIFTTIDKVRELLKKKLNE